MRVREQSKVRTAVGAVLATALLCALVLGGLWATGRMLPSWSTFNAVSKFIDLNSDGAPEHLQVSARQLVVEDAHGAAAFSPADWIVADCKAADINHDNTTELVILAWRRGSFGESHPFWYEGLDRAFTQHVFVVQFKDGQLLPLWMSSDVGEKVASMRIVGSSYIGLTSADGEETIWEWGSWGLALVEDKLITLTAVGDNLIHDTLYETMRTDDARGFDFTDLYAPMRSYVSSFDFAAVQQETILTNDMNALSSYPSFATPAAVADALVETGFDIVCAASNHAFDQGEEGIMETCAIWDERHPHVSLLGIHPSDEDAQRVHIIQKDGITLACFDYTYGLNGKSLPAGKDYLVDLADDKEKIAADLARAQDADMCICFAHMGEELSSQPSEDQRSFASLLIDAGADCVIFTHAHRAQPSEVLQTTQGDAGVVFWCLGNFASHMTERVTLLEQAAQIVVRKRADGTCWIADWGASPLVCHFEPGATQVMLLEDYTDALAARHSVSSQANPLTCEELWQQWLILRPLRGNTLD